MHNRIETNPTSRKGRFPYYRAPGRFVVRITRSPVRRSVSAFTSVVFLGPLLSLGFVPAVSATGSENITTPSLSVVGNKVLTAAGKQYIPEGISIYGGLEQRNYMRNIANDDAQIEAAAKYWQANTIRLQVAESNLFTNLTPGRAYNNNFLQAVVRQVDLIRSLNKVAVINDQTEFTNRTQNPTEETVKFWRVMDATFGNQPYILFDLFNEPRLTSFGTSDNRRRGSSANVTRILRRLSKPGLGSSNDKANRMSPSEVWNAWQHGGVISGVWYVGMQTLVNQIRGQGVHNIIWVEGPYTARALPEGHHLLTGSNIVYAFHHVNLNRPTSWNSIGKLDATHAVVDGEWAQYRSNWAECYGNAYIEVPLYLNYLQAHHIGLIAWSLQANSLVQAKNDWRGPSNINIPSDPGRASALQRPDKLLPSYSCSDRFGQGAGQLLMNYFSRNSVQYRPFANK